MPYRYLPSGVIFRSAQWLVPSKSSGTVEIVCRSIIRAGSAYVVKNGDRVRQFVDHIDVPTVGMKREVPGTGSRRRADERLIVRSQRCVLRVEAIGKHFVQPQVGSEREPIVRTDNETVSVWLLLTGGINARSGMLNEGSGFA